MWRIAARCKSSIKVWNWYIFKRGIWIYWSVMGGRTELLADSASGAYRIWRFALSVFLCICGKSLFYWFRSVEGGRASYRSGMSGGGLRSESRRDLLWSGVSDQVSGASQSLWSPKTAGKRGKWSRKIPKREIWGRIKSGNHRLLLLRSSKESIWRKELESVGWGYQTEETRSGRQIPERTGRWDLLLRIPAGNFLKTVESVEGICP